MKYLDHVDKNGTEHWVDNVCEKCGGRGVIPQYYFVAGGECFDCGGSGIGHTTWQVRTPEYQAKLDVRAAAKMQKKTIAEKLLAPERNAAFLEQNGFDADGFTYVVLGNTFDIKETLKLELNGKFHNPLGWHLPVDTEKYPTVKISVDDVFYKDYADTYRWQQWKGNDEETYSAKIEAAKLAIIEASNAGTEFVGSVGDKVELTLTLMRHFSFDTQFGTSYVFKFKDEQGNSLVWKTGTFLLDENGNLYSDGTVLRIKATIKGHEVYKGEKQTQLIRCKVIPVSNQMTLALN